MNKRAQRSGRQRRHGFTLVEMMVALFAGSVVISGAYFLSGRSANNFNDQMSLAETQTSLRMAMEQVRKDFSRAGYLGTRDSNSPLQPNNMNNVGVATSSIGRVTAATVTLNGSVTAALAPLLNIGNTPTTNRTRADLVSLQGAYPAPVMFPVTDTQGGNPPANQIEVDPSFTTFQMMFFVAPAGGGPGVYNPALFNQVFAPGRAIRFESQGAFYFRRITAPNGAANPPTIQLDANLPGPTFAPRVGAFVAPLAMVQYSVDPITSAVGTPADLTALRPINASVASNSRAALVRREISYANNLPVVPNAVSVVLDNLVEFQVNEIINPQAAPLVPTFTDVPGGTSAATPEQLRSLIVTLSARSPEGERTRAHLPRAALNLPMLTFIGNDVVAGQFYVSRVRTMRAEIFLPNTINK